MKRRTGTVYVTLDCRYKDSEVYNARVSFLFSGDSLMIVSG
jgi:hypothetical protein